MERKDNYAIQAKLAQARFLTYDQQKIIDKFRLAHDEAYLYPMMLGSRYRLDRHSGNFQREVADNWVDANSFGEVLTLLDILCDAKDLRYLTGRWKAIHHFGHMSHQSLAEDSKHFLAEAFDRDEAALRRACDVMGARPIPGGDFGCAIELFDGLSIGMLFWHGDEEFSPRLRYYWDDNALQYIRYETMYYAMGLLETRLKELL